MGGDAGGVCVAQEMGARLGRGEVLFGKVPGGEGEGVFCKKKRMSDPLKFCLNAAANNF